MKTLAHVLFLFLCSIQLVRSQPLQGDVRPFTLEDAILRARANSHEARIARLEYNAASWDFRAFQSRYLPSLFLSGNAPGYIRSFDNIVQDDGTLSFVEQRRTFSRAGLSMSQALPFSGGTLQVSTALNYIDQRGLFNSTQWQTTPLSINLTQPLFQFNAMKWERRTEPIQLDLARKNYIQDLAENDTEIANLFFAVYETQNSINIASFNVAVNDTIFVLSQGRYDIGRIAENDLLQSELQLINAQTELSTALINHERALQELRTALDLPPGYEIEVIPPLRIPSIDISPDEAVAAARQYRPLFQDLELQELLAQQEVERSKRINNGINVSASYGLNQNSAEFENAYADPLSQQQFNVNIQMPLYQWGGRRSRIQSAIADKNRAAEERQLQEKEFDQSVYFQAKQLDLLEQQVAIAAQADTIATRRFEVARNRYLVGNIDITDLFDAQREKDLANNTYIQTLRQFWLSLYTLRQLTLYDFDRSTPLAFAIER